MIFEIYYIFNGAHLASAARALVVFLPRPEILHIFWAPRNKKSQIPEVVLVDFGPDGHPCTFY